MLATSACLCAWEWTTTFVLIFCIIVFSSNSPSRNLNRSNTGFKITKNELVRNCYFLYFLYFQCVCVRVSPRADICLIRDNGEINTNKETSTNGGESDDDGIRYTLTIARLSLYLLERQLKKEISNNDQREEQRRQTSIKVHNNSDDQHENVFLNKHIRLSLSLSVELTLTTTHRDGGESGSQKKMKEGIQREMECR
eukprot:gene9314-6553_t